MTTGADTAVSRRALFGLGLTRALEGAGLGADGGPVRVEPRFSRAVPGAGEADATRLGAGLGPLAAAVLGRLLPGDGERLLVAGAGDGTPVVGAALAAGHRVTAVEGAGGLRERGVAAHPDASWLPGLRDADDRAFDLALAWLPATYDPDPRMLAAGLLRAARPGGIVAVTAWTGAAMRRLRAGPPPAGHRPESWSRYETAYRHFFDLDDLDVEPLEGLEGLDAALVVARAPRG